VEGVGDGKFELGMALPRQGEHGRTKIHSGAASRADGREEIAQPATDFQNPLSRWDQKRIMPLEQLMIVPLAFAEATIGAAIVEDPAVGHGPQLLPKNRARDQRQKAILLRFASRVQEWAGTASSPLFQSRWLF